ncbi:NADH-quinone oxidoreductase [Malaciobacter molluscorum LMG 25693]|uniref:NADH-quinone oxidoreductase subunit A n=1 Tax=Malaciobacter molluscorum LMG 25693 TaxID=870501 RepID=A0A2G1DHG3_9BACT|nr:NADH-quinone oxidoreductase subunit A [Malaciobacter molluscorum]AXX93292.1 NADH:quinone oxidoreductase I, membrane subunit A [Malaciobacter molluscorum LMG 25693]PHO17949.1 NADH-quinone oxidoreductase [Malaciobacter molluscorum LMG 25693]RXJ95189.1 NADH-quinone oxidoreductase [Malaciobacter molluscorum]
MSTELLLSASVFVIMGLVLVSVFVLTRYLGPNNKDDKQKNTVYESGVSNPVGTTNLRFSIKFYLVAILFVIFDVEIIFMFPWAVNIRELGFLGLAEMFMFMALLFAGLIYIYKKKALSWD